MSIPTNRRWISFALLSVIVPISLLATFRLTGILPEPPTPETTTVEPVTWNIKRPLVNPTVGRVAIDQWVKNSHSKSITSVNLSIWVLYYSENFPDFPSWGGDYIDLRIIGTANVSEGFIYSMVIRFSQTDVQSSLRIEVAPEARKLENLEMRRMTRMREVGTNKREAYFEAIGLNQPKDSSLSIYSYWRFFDENDVNHWMTITLETIYFNGTEYQKTAIPISLGVLVP